MIPLLTIDPEYFNFGVKALSGALAVVGSSAAAIVRWLNGLRKEERNERIEATKLLQAQTVEMATLTTKAMAVMNQANLLLDRVDRQLEAMDREPNSRARTRRTNEKV